MKSQEDLDISHAYLRGEIDRPLTHEEDENESSPFEN